MTVLAGVLVAVVVGVPLALMLAHVLFVLAFSYRLDDVKLQLLLFRCIPVLTVRFSEVAEARVVPMAHVLVPRSWSMFNAIRASNRAFIRRAAVVVRRNKRWVVATPLDPNEFCRHINDRVDAVAKPRS